MFLHLFWFIHDFWMVCVWPSGLGKSLFIKWSPLGFHVLFLSSPCPQCPCHCLGPSCQSQLCLLCSAGQQGCDWSFVTEVLSLSPWAASAPNPILAEAKLPPAPLAPPPQQGREGRSSLWGKGKEVTHYCHGQNSLHLGKRNSIFLSIKIHLNSQNDNKNCSATLCPPSSASFLHPWLWCSGIHHHPLGKLPW